MYPYKNDKIIEKKTVENTKNNKLSVSTKRLLELLSMAAEDELKDINYYKSIISRTEDEMETKVIKDIYMNAAKHYSFLKKIYSILTSEDMEEIESDTLEGPEFEKDIKKELEKALFKELENVEFYRQMFSFLDNIEMLKMLYEIITDKQNNSIKLSYILTK